MIDEQLARLRTHRNNIARYRHLLKTKLSDLERPIYRKAPIRRAIGLRAFGGKRLPHFVQHFARRCREIDLSRGCIIALSIVEPPSHQK